MAVSCLENSLLLWNLKVHELHHKSPPLDPDFIRFPQRISAGSISILGLSLHLYLDLSTDLFPCNYSAKIIRGPFEKFLDWQQCTAVIQREAETVMPSSNGGGNVVVA
jgi:hypothetical protein